MNRLTIKYKVFIDFFYDKEKRILYPHYAMAWAERTESTPANFLLVKKKNLVGGIMFDERIVPRFAIMAKEKEGY